MTDKELLGLAAKAAGFTIHENGVDVHGDPWWWCDELGDNWNPLYFDGDALRLAVKLEFLVRIGNGVIIVDQIGQRDYWQESYTDDPYTATRRAIVRAAADIGKQLCSHEWVDARNEKIVSGEICTKCFALRTGNAN